MMNFRTVALVTMVTIVQACAAPHDPAPNAVYDESLHEVHETELLVLDPPADYLRHLPDMSLEIIDIVELSSVGDKIYHLRILDGAHPFDAREEHAERFPDVLVDAHHHYGHHATAADKSYTAVKAAQWTANKSTCGKGLKIGVIDGVVEPKHAAFKGSKITYKSFAPKNKPVANTGHGTAVAAIIGGSKAWGGILPGADIVAANVFYKTSTGGLAGSSMSIVQAIDWMVANKVPVVNMSIGGGKNVLISKAVDHAAQAGTIMIASAGNDGPFSKKKNYPSAYDHVVAVTAVNQFDRSANFASVGDYIDFAAPGVDIWTAVPGGGKAMSGTSFAAPIVTAYAAVARERLGLKTLDEIQSYFKTHAIDRGKEGHDRYTGWGILRPPPGC